MLNKIPSFFALGLLALIVGASTFLQQPKPKQSPKKQKTSIKKNNSKTIDSSIVWYNMTDGYAKAIKENKFLIVDVYTDWCYWCKVMDKETYADKAMAVKINTYAVAVKFNPEKNDKHIFDNDTLSSNQLLSFLNRGGRNSGYPTTFFWKSLKDQSKIASYPGYRKLDEFNEIVNSYINN